jgi:hypothetical protein
MVPRKLKADDSSYVAGIELFVDGFSIPSHTANRAMSKLLPHGRVKRGHLGIAVSQRALDRR